MRLRNIKDNGMICAVTALFAALILFVILLPICGSYYEWAAHNRYYRPIEGESLVVAVPSAVIVDGATMITDMNFDNNEIGRNKNVYEYHARISLSDGTVVYESGELFEGDSRNNIALNKKLGPGRYRASVTFYIKEQFSDDIDYSSYTYNTTLIVRR